MVLLLLREYFDGGVNGKLFIDEQFVCHTIERPWLNNERQVSCIPEGKYTVHARETKRFGKHLTVDQVEGRSAILIHTFNHAVNESRGCIAPVSQITGQGEGLGSRLALDKLLKLLKPAMDRNKTVFLIIKKSANENTDQKSK